MTTPTRPMLEEPQIEDRHKRTVVIQLSGLDPLPGGYSHNAAVRFQPQTLQLIWDGAPAELRGAWLSGPELTKSGAQRSGGVRGYRGYLTRDAEDTPDWIRELIDRYTPHWPELPTVE